MDKAHEAPSVNLQNKTTKHTLTTPRQWTARRAAVRRHCSL